MLIGSLDDVVNALHEVGVKLAILLDSVKCRLNQFNLSIHFCHATIKTLDNAVNLNNVGKMVIQKITKIHLSLFDPCFSNHLICKW